LLEIECVSESEEHHEVAYVWLCIFDAPWQMTGLVHIQGPLGLPVIKIHFPKPYNVEPQIIVAQEIRMLAPLQRAATVGQIMGFVRESFPLWSGEVHSLRELEVRLGGLDPTLTPQKMKHLYRLLPGPHHPARCGAAAPLHFQEMLSALHLRTRDVVLDPWAVNQCLAAMHDCAAQLVFNVYGSESIGVPCLRMNPLTSALYHYVITCFGRLDVIVTSPPPSLLDVHLPLLLAAATKAVCIHVPVSYFHTAQGARASLFQKYENNGQLIPGVTMSCLPANATHMWLCFLGQSASKKGIMHPDWWAQIRSV
jgi:hypothetical protein